MMRRRKLTVKKIIILMIIVALIYPFILSGLRLMFAKNTNEEILNKTTNQQIESQEFKNAKAEEELLKYKLKEQEEKARQEKIKALQNPEIIEKELNKVGKLITYEGKIYYKDEVLHKSFFASRKLTLKLFYRFGIAIDLKNITIDEFIEDTVVLKIPKNSLVLEYIQLIPEESYVNGEKSLLAKYFTPEEVKILLDEAQNTTIERVNNTNAIFDKAEESLKDNLKEIILKLGYKRVIFSN